MSTTTTASTTTASTSTTSTTPPTAELAAVALGNDGQSYRYWGVLAGVNLVTLPQGVLYRFEDGSAILDSNGGGWDVAVWCVGCGEWTWEGPLPDCGQCHGQD